MVTFPISVEDESDDEKMVLWQRVWRLWTNEDGGELREDWKWKGSIFWHISLLKDKHISRVSWNTNAPKEYFDSHPSPLQRPQNAKGFEAKASLWPDFRDSDKGFQFMGTLLERFKSEGMAWARIRGWCVGSQHLWTNCRRDSPRPILTHRQCVACAVCSSVNSPWSWILHTNVTTHGTVP